MTGVVLEVKGALILPLFSLIQVFDFFIERFSDIICFFQNFPGVCVWGGGWLVDSPTNQSTEQPTWGLALPILKSSPSRSSSFNEFLLARAGGVSSSQRSAGASGSRFCAVEMKFRYSGQISDNSTCERRQRSPPFHWCSRVTWKRTSRPS